MIEAFIAELEQETATTRSFLQAVPADKLAWRPHDKSMTLGQLAMHVATLPAGICGLASMSSFDAAEADFTPGMPDSAAVLLPALSESFEHAKTYLQNLDEDACMEPWTLTNHGEEIFTVPRVALLRSLLFNHWYHHRGQLSVYLRLLNVPVPVAYGRTADINPFG